MSARDAARLLGVKLQTLYAYASRGWLGRGQRGPGRRSQYPLDAVMRLKARADARSGHGAVAASALAWGEPVLDSAITELGPKGPVYRGQAAVDLAMHDVSFEAVAELLWAPTEQAHAPAARAPSVPRPLSPPWPRPQKPAPTVPVAPGRVLLELARATAQLGLADDARLGASAEAERARARQLITQLVGGLMPVGAPKARAGRPVSHSEGVAAVMLRRLGAKSGPQRIRLLQRCLVVIADHELNASTFAARVAASAGADLYGCLTVAFATLSGPRHGGACDRVEAMLHDADREGAQTVVKSRLMRGDALPGFELNAYQGDDPRTVPVLELCRGALRDSHVEVALEVAEAARHFGAEPMGVDFALAVAARALGLPPGAAGAIFGLGRMAGWVAHVLEQRQSGRAIRPRARHVGVAAPTVSR